MRGYDVMRMMRFFTGPNPPARMKVEGQPQRLPCQLEHPWQHDGFVWATDSKISARYPSTEGKQGVEQPQYIYDALKQLDAAKDIPGVRLPVSVTDMWDEDIYQRTVYYQGREYDAVTDVDGDVIHMQMRRADMYDLLEIEVAKGYHISMKNVMKIEAAAFILCENDTTTTPPQRRGRPSQFGVKYKPFQYILPDGKTHPAVAFEVLQLQGICMALRID